MNKTAWRSPTEVADDLVRQHICAMDCVDCEPLEDDDLCRWHEGYREGVLILLLKAMGRR
jgi:hypothetical protein